MHVYQTLTAKAQQCLKDAAKDIRECVRQSGLDTPFSKEALTDLRLIEEALRMLSGVVGE